jgi:hypothetical protein
MAAKQRNVLVVSSVERPVDELRSVLGDDVGEVYVVVPAVRQSRLQWLANDEDEARQQAKEAAAEIADAVPTEAEATVGDSDPVLAAKDALREFRADEVVVVTRPDEEATWLEEGSGKEIERELGGLPVKRITVAEEA